MMLRYSTNRPLESTVTWPIIVITMFIAVTLEFFPWPGSILWMMPSFPDLALIYWAINRPRLVNFSAALILGLLMDLSAQLPLGFHCLSYTVLVALTNGMRGRFSLLGPLGQAIHVLVVLSCGQMTLFLLKLLDAGEWSVLGWRMFMPSATAAALWLLLPLIMQWLAAKIFGQEQDE